VNTPSIKTQVKTLSGGNIQKLILGRELVDTPNLLVASHPTYGLDVGATEYIRNQLLKQREQGGAILLVSEDLEELFALTMFGLGASGLWGKPFVGKPLAAKI
jgi:simple sugar transport system ATP-binding protein